MKHLASNNVPRIWIHGGSDSYFRNEASYRSRPTNQAAMSWQCRVIFDPRPQKHVSIHSSIINHHITSIDRQPISISLQTFHSLRVSTEHRFRSFNHLNYPLQTNPTMHYHLALLTLLALSISAIIIEPIEPIEPEPIYITLPGWPPCPSQCVIAVPKETPHAAQEPVCFAEPAHDPPCSYYYCCGEPVSSSPFFGQVDVD